MLIKTAFSTKKTGFVFRSYRRKGFNRKKTGFVWRQHTQKSRLDKNRIYIHKNSFYQVFFFCVRAKKRKEKRREAFLPTAKNQAKISIPVHSESSIATFDYHVSY
jgi:hypothetical protein